MMSLSSSVSQPSDQEHKDTCMSSLWGSLLPARKSPAYASIIPPHQANKLMADPTGARDVPAEVATIMDHTRPESSCLISHRYIMPLCAKHTCILALSLSDRWVSPHT